MEKINYKMQEEMNITVFERDTQSGMNSNNRSE